MVPRRESRLTASTSGCASAKQASLVCSRLALKFHETEDYTIYPAPIITVTKNRFTKHYFVGDKRVASKLGVGKFSNVYGISSNNVTAGQKDYAARMMQIEKQREEYYKSLGTPPGVPTMKGATADPDNTGYGYNSIIGELGDHSVPEGWVQRPKFNDKGDVPGPPIQWQKPEDPDNAQPGYGYVPADTTNTEEIFFYHSDHLGSTSYITDAKANITQFDAYLPYGELLVDEHSSSEEMPYKFNGKELDQETGLYYYGARYMNPVTSLWYGVDPLAEKYPSVGGYVYCVGNPVKLIDPNGLENVVVVGDQGNSPNSDQYLRKNENQRHFLERGLQDAIKFKKKDPEETTTMLVYKGHYTEKELSYYKGMAEKNGISFELASNEEDIISYINYGTADVSRSDRDSDPITDFEYVGHGHPTGFYIEPLGNGDYKSFNSERFDARAFDVNANIYLYGCGQGLTGSALHDIYPDITISTLIDNMQRLTRGTIVGYSVTLEWGKNLGSFIPYNLGYRNTNDRLRRRPTIPENKRKVTLKGTRQ